MVLLMALPEQRLELLNQPVDVLCPPPRRLPPVQHAGTHQHSQSPPSITPRMKLSIVMDTSPLCSDLPERLLHPRGTPLRAVAVERACMPESRAKPMPYSPEAVLSPPRALCAGLRPEPLAASRDTLGACGDRLAPSPQTACLLVPPHQYGMCVGQGRTPLQLEHGTSAGTTVASLS